MTGTGAAGMRVIALGLFAAASALSLSGCGSIDEALFSGSEQEQAAAPAPANATAQAAPAPAQPAPPPAEGAAPAAPPPEGAPAAAPSPVAAAPLAPPSVAGEFAPVAVAPGANTGTTVSQTVATLRSQLEGLESKFVANAQHFAELRSAGEQNAAAYQEATGRISAHLASGTTRGNPELITQWNGAQGALDSLTTNINGLGQLASDLSNDSRAAHQEYDTIQSTFDASGGVDEDHRQLNVLSDETGQTIVIIDRLLHEVKQTLDRETAYVASERGNLTTLASAIRAGEYSPLVPAHSERGATAERPSRATVAAAPAATSTDVAAAIQSGGPIVTIKFGHAHKAYDRLLYSALSQALAAKPSASFSVVGVSPAGGAEAGVQVAQNSAQHEAQDVMKTMGEMGVPASRMTVSSSTDAAIAASEVRVYVK